uniref:Ku70/Ku80 N-terminal alpha/beta domain-containing protein n=1 Tax=Acrobeloides nanus TaxID=290746 RepID=A0A914CMW2_9BILA
MVTVQSADSGKRATVLIVDCADEMFSETIDGQPLFTIALKGIREQINYLCCAGDLQEYSVLMFINTAQTNDDAHHQESVYVHRAMNNMNADWVREIDGWIASGMS